MKIIHYLLLILIQLSTSLACSEFPDKTEESHPITKFDLLLNQIRYFENTVTTKKQELNALFRPADFAKRQQINKLIQLQKSAIISNLENAAMKNKITPKEYLVLSARLFIAYNN